MQNQNIAYSGLSNTFSMTYGYNLQGVRTGLTTQMNGSNVFSNTYEPDGLGRIGEIDQVGPNLASLTVSLGYTNDGKLNNVERSQTTGTFCNVMATSTYTYYNDGMLDKLSEDQGSQNYRTDLLSYDLAGRTKSESSISILKTPDVTHTGSDPANLNNIYTYDDSGQLTQIQDLLRSNTTNTNFGPDGNPKPAPGTVIGANNELQQDANDVYQYDNEGNLTTQWIQDPSYQMLAQDGNAFTSSTLTLTSVGTYEIRISPAILFLWTGTAATAPKNLTVTLGIATKDGTQSFTKTYNVAVTYSNGNLNPTGQSSIIFSLPAGFPGSNLILAAEFDVPGNDPTLQSQLKLQTGGSVLYHDTSIDVFKYDYLNRLVEVDVYSATSSGTPGSVKFTRPSDGVTVDAVLAQTNQYAYDVFGSRIAECNTDLTASPSKTTSTWFVNDGTNIALKLTQKPGDSAPAVSQVRLNGTAVDQLLAIHDINLLTPNHTPPIDVVQWPLPNRQNTILDVESLGQQKATSDPYDNRAAFDVFGKPDPTTLIVGVDSVYAGMEYDPATQLYYDHARFYNSAMQRFINRDPLGLSAGDTNEYRYCGNSPTNATDPTGCIANVVVGAGVGLVFGVGAYFYQLSTGDIQNFSWGGLAGYAVAGTAAGAVAGATFGASLAIAGAGVSALALTGTTAAVATGSITLGLTGTAMGAAGGLAGGVVTGALGATAQGASPGQIAMAGLTTGLSGAGRGAFYGGISGAAAGAVLPFAAMAGIGIGGGTLGGGLALGGSFALGDAVAQGLGLAAGLQNRYSLSQTIFAGGTGFLLGAYAGYQDPRLLVFSSGFRYLTLDQVTRNRLGHEAAVDDFREQAAENGFNVVGEGEVSVRTPGGRLRKYDTALENPATRAVSGIEIKSTPGAMTRNDAAARQQFAMDAWVNTYGAQVVGANRAMIANIHTTARIFWPAPPDPVDAGWWGYTALGSTGSITKRKD